MAPSSETSTHLEAPAQLESPYHAIICIAQGIHSSQSTSNELGAPGQSEGRIGIQTDKTGSPAEERNGETSPAKERNPFLIQPTRPTLVSPTPIRTGLREALKETSVSFLVDDDEPFDSTMPIPPLHFDPWPAPPAEVPGPDAPHKRTIEELLVEVEALKERNARTQA